MSNAGTIDLDGKIISALERLSNVLRTLLWQEAVESRFSPIQIQTLLYMTTHSADLCRVGQLAREFGLTAATMSDVVTALQRKGLLTRRRSRADHRRQTLHLTVRGRRHAEALSRWNEVLAAQLAQFPVEEREQALVFLLKLIESLYRAGVITVARTCLTCRFYRRGVRKDPGASDYCALMDKPLAKRDLRIDCPDHRLP